jgi:hypothetical protein
MRKLGLTTAAFAMALTLASCGYSRGDRALSGGALGAAGGAGIAAITDGDPLTGAVLGGLGGAAIGALTSPSDVNLGRPAWRRGDPYYYGPPGRRRGWR